METKKCTKCGEVKGLEEFHKDRTTKSGLSPSCKVCSLLRRKAYRDSHLEKVRKASKDWRTSNPDKARRSTENWRARNPEKVLKMEEARRVRNPERNLEWRTSNPDKARRSTENWRARNSEKIKEWRKKYVTSLSDGYIMTKLKRGCSALQPIHIDHEIIELKRLTLQIKRELKRQEQRK